MKRIISLTCIAGVVGWLCSGCDDGHAPPTSRIRPSKVVHRGWSKPAKPKKEILPGTVAYLDSRNSFRDVTFGELETNIPNLVEASRDEARRLTTCTRSNETMSFQGVLLEQVEYNFFRGELYAIQLKWKIAHVNSTLSQPPTTDISVYCAQEYGAPRSHRMSKDSAHYAWRGRRVEIDLTESLLPGLADPGKGGWVLPPTTTGRMLIRNLALSRAAELSLIANPTQHTDDL